MNDADRCAALAVLKQQLRRFEDLGLKKPAALSVREYLGQLAAAGAIESETAVLAAGIYERCRFGKGSIATEDVKAALAALLTDAACLELMDEAERPVLIEPAPRRNARREERKRTGPPRGSQPTIGPRRRAGSVDPTAAQLVSRRKRRVEHGPSRLWTFIACGLALWTLAVMAGSLWQRERIERMLGSSEWGRPLISRLRGEQKEQLELRRRIENDKHSATATDFARLAEHYVERRQYAEAIYAYQQGLARVPPGEQRGYMLSDLAWMLLTAEDPWYRDALQARQLAEQAVSLCEAPEHYDTLAEAYAQNGNFLLAVDAETEAVALAKEKNRSLRDQGYFQRRLGEFEDAAKASNSSLPAAP
jgi:hypothetical protein